MFRRLGHGSLEFLTVRICAVFLLLYTLYLSGFILITDEVNFNQWSAFLAIQQIKYLHRYSLWLLQFILGWVLGL